MIRDTVTITVKLERWPNRAPNQVVLESIQRIAAAIALRSRGRVLRIVVDADAGRLLGLLPGPGTVTIATATGDVDVTCEHDPVAMIGALP